MLETFLVPQTDSEKEREIFSCRRKETRGVIERDREKRKEGQNDSLSCKNIIVWLLILQAMYTQGIWKFSGRRESKLLYNWNPPPPLSSWEGTQEKVNGMDRTISCSWSVRRERTKYILQVYNRDNGVCNDDDDNDDAFEFLSISTFLSRTKNRNRMTGILSFPCSSFPILFQFSYPLLLLPDISQPPLFFPCKSFLSVSFTSDKILLARCVFKSFLCHVRQWWFLTFIPQAKKDLLDDSNQCEVKEGHGSNITAYKLLNLSQFSQKTVNPWREKTRIYDSNLIKLWHVFWYLKGPALKSLIKKGFRKLFPKRKKSLNPWWIFEK